MKLPLFLIFAALATLMRPAAAAVTTPVSSLITDNSATLGGTVDSVGGGTVTERGVIYAISTANNDPRINGTGVTKVTASGTIGAFTVDLSGLDPATGYTFRAYATTTNGATYDYSAVLTFTTLPLPPPTFTDLSNVGLWIGEVELNEVQSQAETPPAWRSTPAPFRYTIIMHVDSRGYARLLPEATLMQTKTVPALPVIVTQSTLLGNFDGITPRGGKQVGQRFSASNFPPPPAGTSLSYDGSTWITGSVTLAASHPLNPFRHKYHPDLRTGRTVRRDYVIQANPADSRSDHNWQGTIQDVVHGISKRGLESRGTVTFTRVSDAGKLNQP